MRKKSIGYRAVMLVLLGLLLALPTRAAHAGEAELTPSSPPKPVPDITFTTADGRIKSLSDYRGKVLLINFWATWCAPCVLEMPSLNRLQARLGGRNFMVLPVAMDSGGLAEVGEFYQEQGLTSLGIFLQKDRSVAKLIRPRGLPLSLLVDAEGREVARALGSLTWDSPAMIRRIEAMLPPATNITPTSGELYFSK